MFDSILCCVLCRTYCEQQEWPYPNVSSLDDSAYEEQGDEKKKGIWRGNGPDPQLGDQSQNQRGLVPSDKVLSSPQPS